MKKIVFSIFIIITLIIKLSQMTYAETILYEIGKNTAPPLNQATTQSQSQTTTTSGTSFIKKAFTATKNFFNEKVEDKDGRVSEIFKFIKKIIKVINRVLLVTLAGLSMISLAVIGIKYIMSTSMAGRMSQAKEELKTVVIGMAFGFGAYAIWMVGISLIEIIIGTLS